MTRYLVTHVVNGEERAPEVFSTEFHGEVALEDVAEKWASDFENTVARLRIYKLMEPATEIVLTRKSVVEIEVKP